MPRWPKGGYYVHNETVTIETELREMLDRVPPEARTAVLKDILAKIRRLRWRVIDGGKKSAAKGD